MISFSSFNKYIYLFCQVEIKVSISANISTTVVDKDANFLVIVLFNFEDYLLEHL